MFLLRTCRGLPLAWVSLASAWLLFAAGGPAPRQTPVAERGDEARAGRALPCEPIALEATLLDGAQVVLLGDFHGTAEIPAFFSDVACTALRRVPALIVALEIPADEQERVDRYLGSSGSGADRAALLEGGFWRDAYQDGRRSAAMAALIERLRTLRQEGPALPGPHRLEVLLLDSPAVSSAGERDRRMAAAILGALRPGAPGAAAPLVLALAGNLHTRTVQGSPWDASHVPMGCHLARSLPEGSVRSLDVAHLGGTAWFCTGADPASCGEKPLKGVGEVPHATIRLFPRPDERGFNGVYFVGRLSASPPARRP